MMMLIINGSNDDDVDNNKWIHTTAHEECTPDDLRLLIFSLMYFLSEN